MLTYIYLNVDECLNSTFCLIMLTFNKKCFLELLLMVLVALTLVEVQFIFCSHHISIHNGRHNPSCLTE